MGGNLGVIWAFFVCVLCEFWGRVGVYLYEFGVCVYMNLGVCMCKNLGYV